MGPLNDLSPNPGIIRVARGLVRGTAGRAGTQPILAPIVVLVVTRLPETLTLAAATAVVNRAQARFRHVTWRS